MKMNVDEYPKTFVIDVFLVVMVDMTVIMNRDYFITSIHVKNSSKQTPTRRQRSTHNHFQDLSWNDRQQVSHLCWQQCHRCSVERP